MDEAHSFFLNHVIYYGLFQQSLFEEKDLLSMIPRSAFGVFSTIRRAQRLDHWPEDVHGCIGYWNPSFDPLSPATLFSKVNSVTHSAIHTDDRRHYFGSIELDPNTVVEVDWMMTPLQSVDLMTGYLEGSQLRFTNEKYGLIVQTMSSPIKKATYLPHVFPSTMKWSDLLESIRKKAGIESNESIRCYAYEIQQWTAPLHSLLTMPFFTHYQMGKVIRTLFEHQDTSQRFLFPYEYQKGRYRWNQEEEVRNLSIMSDMVKWTTTYPFLISSQNRRLLQQSVERVIPTIHSPQALSFIGHLYTLGIRLPDKRVYCGQLLDRLEDADRDFEQPERIIGAKKAGCEMRPLPSLTFDMGDSIFRMNWILQARIATGQTLSPTMIRVFFDTVKRSMSNTMETNEIAVLFEGLCYIHKYLPSSAKEARNRLFPLWYQLEERKQENGLYAFVNGNARVDITGHVLNGLYELHRPKTA